MIESVMAGNFLSFVPHKLNQSTERRNAYICNSTVRTHTYTKSSCTITCLLTAEVIVIQGEMPADGISKRQKR